MSSSEGQPGGGGLSSWSLIFSPRGFENPVRNSSAPAFLIPKGIASLFLGLVLHRPKKDNSLLYAGAAPAFLPATSHPAITATPHRHEDGKKKGGDCRNVPSGGIFSSAAASSVSSNLYFYNHGFPPVLYFFFVRAIPCNDIQLLSPYLKNHTQRSSLVTPPIPFPSRFVIISSCCIRNNADVLVKGPIFSADNYFFLVPASLGDLPALLSSPSHPRKFNVATSAFPSSPSLFQPLSSYLRFFFFDFVFVFYP